LTGKRKKERRKIIYCLFIYIYIYKQYQEIIMAATEEKEIELLREALDKSEKRIGYKMVQSETSKMTMTIVEEFIKRKKLICYGGTAINNILPKKAQFYDKKFELPDYDVFSPNAINDAKELTDIFYKKGFENVETRAAMNVGTYKVYVNFYGVADITFLDPKLYSIFLKKGLKINQIHYSPVNFLRMEMYKELSRPQSEISRWEKVFKRLQLLNKYYPIHNKKCNKKIEFMRNFTGNKDLEEELYTLLKECLIKEGVVFIGAYATELYTEHMPGYHQHLHIPDFDVLAVNAKKTADDVMRSLKKHGIQNVQIEKKNELWKTIPVHYEISIGKNVVCVIYETIACHSYNAIKEEGKEIKVASIDTLMNFLFAFLFQDNNYYDEMRLMCMAEYLMHLQEKNRLKTKGIFKRFSVNCYGEERTIEKIRELKSEKFKMLKKKKGSKEYQKYFLRYNPLEEIEHRQKQARKTAKKQTKKNRTVKKKLLGKFINPFF
jgi:hypothetical protein